MRSPSCPVVHCGTRADAIRGVHFVDFLRATVLLSAAAATALVIVTVLSAAPSSDPTIVPISVGWWVLASAIGLWLGRRAEVHPPIARLLREAKTSTALPEYRPGATLLNRLWPLLLFTVVAGGLAFLAPQIPRHRRWFRDRARVVVAPPGCRRGGDRGARRRALPRAAHLSAARNRAGAHARLQGAAPGTHRRRHDLSRELVRWRVGSSRSALAQMASTC